jgi:UDP-N-acetylglucosamine--N-acetylmuramyl-(pentapeptide) pyrophosphoryl-undecaprenol N-acetylglucosamine transferase
MAALLGKPLVLVNADAALLLSNKALLPVADRVAFGFDGAAQGARARRWSPATRCAPRSRRCRPGRALRRPQRPAALLVVGGSLGARVLNETLPRALALIDPAQRPQVVHQTGALNRDACAPPTAPPGGPTRPRAEVLPFIDDMARAWPTAT